MLFGTGSVAAAVATGAQVGLWQVAAVWGFGVALAIYATAGVSGAHLNPAVTLSFALMRSRKFPLRLVVPYWGAQLAGAVAAGTVVFFVFGPFIERFEDDNDIERGEPGSQHSAMMFGEYFPNPDVYGTSEDDFDLISPLGAAIVEALGTSILVLMIFSLTDRGNSALPARGFAPFMIGFTVAVLISLFAPLTQGGWNPARDFGPRIVAALGGWEEIAIPGPRNGFWVYIAGPLVGGPVGACVWEYILRPALNHVDPRAAADDDAA